MTLDRPAMKSDIQMVLKRLTENVFPKLAAWLHIRISTCNLTESYLKWGRGNCDIGQGQMTSGLTVLYDWGKSVSQSVRALT